MENATLSIKGFKTNEPVFLECTLGYHDDERFARRMRMCLKLNDTDTDDTVCVLTSDLLPDIVVNKSGHSPNEGRITTIMSVRITNPERREVYLWCCYISDNKTVVADMENYLLENSVKTPSEDDLVGKRSTSNLIDNCTQFVHVYVLQWFSVFRNALEYSIYSDNRE